MFGGVVYRHYLGEEEDAPENVYHLDDSFHRTSLASPLRSIILLRRCWVGRR